MHRSLKTVLFSFLLISFVQASDQNRIDGISNYLAGISEKNFQYIVERQLINNKLLACYFPKVHASIETAGLLNAINFDTETWSAYFEEDLQRYFSVALLQVVDPDKLDNMISVARDNYIENFLQKAQVQLPDADQLVTLDTIDIGWTLSDRQIVNSYSTYFADYLSGLADLAERAKQAENLKCNSSGAIPVITDLISDFDDIRENFEQALSTLDDHPLFVDGIEVSAQNFAKAITAYAFLEATHLTERDLRELADVAQSDSLETQVIYIFSKLESADSGMNNRKAYNRFKSFIFLSVKLADSESAATVENALSGYFTDDVSFGTKRRYVFNLTAQAYFNITYDSSVDLVVPTLPLGIEGSWNADGWPVGIMIGVVDFAGPTIAALQDDNSAEFQWAELISPTIQVSLGVPDLPLAGSVAYNIKSATWKVGIGLDMPLINLSR